MAYGKSKKQQRNKKAKRLSNIIEMIKALDNDTVYTLDDKGVQGRHKFTGAQWKQIYGVE